MPVRLFRKKPGERGKKDEANTGADQLHRRQHYRPQLEGLIADRHHDGAGSGAEGHHRGAAQHRGKPDRRHHDGDDRPSDQRAQHHAFEPEAERDHAAYPDQRGNPKRQAGRLGRHGREKTGEHDELALGEIDRVGRLVDQHEAERDQRIHEPDHDAVGQQHQRELPFKIRHVSRPPYSAATGAAALCRIGASATAAGSSTSPIASRDLSAALRPSS